MLIHGFTALTVLKKNLSTLETVFSFFDILPANNVFSE